MDHDELLRPLDFLERAFDILLIRSVRWPVGDWSVMKSSKFLAMNTPLPNFIIALAGRKYFIYHLTMDVKHDLAEIAALIGEPTRAVMLWSLVGGQARPASELAFYANVSAQNASAHLARLVEAGMLAVEARGRHRYYRLAGADIAHAIEALAALSPSAKETAGLPPTQTPDLKYARTCYDHLAGRVAVEMCAALEDKGYIEPDGTDFEITSNGEKLFRDLGMEIGELREQRRAFARKCQDWSERRPHIAGALGAAILDLMFQRGWIARVRSSRIVRVTANGKEDVYRLLKLAL
jgi:DNA-binding transcriptional ArsR family regulator